jgi:hypothetical protein
MLKNRVSSTFWSAPFLHFRGGTERAESIVGVTSSRSLQRVFRCRVVESRRPFGYEYVLGEQRVVGLALDVLVG